MNKILKNKKNNKIYYTTEIIKIIKTSIYISHSINKKKIVIIHPIHLFISLLININIISSLIFTYENKLKLQKIIKYKYLTNNLNIDYKNVKFSKFSLYILNLKENNIFSSIDLFKNILNNIDTPILNLCKYLNIDILNIKQILSIYLNTTIQLPAKFKIFIKKNISNNTYISYDSLNINKLKHILKNNIIKSSLLIGDKGVGKLNLINYCIYTLFKLNKNNNIKILELDTIKIFNYIKEDNIGVFNQYIQSFFNYISKYKTFKFIIIIPNIQYLILHYNLNNYNINLHLNNIIQYAITKYKNISILSTIPSFEYNKLTSYNSCVLLNDGFIKLNINEPSNSIILYKIFKNYIWNTYNLVLDKNIINKLISVSNILNTDIKNPLKLINFFNYIYLNTLKSNKTIKKTFITSKKLNNFLEFYNLKLFKLLYTHYIYKFKNIYIPYVKYPFSYIIKNKINIKYIFNNTNVSNIYFYTYFLFNYTKLILNVYIKNLHNYTTTNKININLFNNKTILSNTLLFSNLSKTVIESNILKTNNSFKHNVLNYINLEKILYNNIFGQDKAIAQILQSIKKNTLGLKTKNKPIGSYIFAGLSGTGKTELAKMLAKGLFGNENTLIRFDMSEFMEKHSVSRLIGSPPGYIGHEDGGQLTNCVLKSPYSIILLDEIEKAHPEINNILLQILDDGRLTDSKGNLIDFSNTIIILTTNLGSPKTLTEYPYSIENINNKYTNFVSNTNKAVEKFFKPEFLNRLNSIIVFKPLDKKELKYILFKFINEFNLKLKKNNIYINIIIELKFIEFILNISYKPLYGARPLKRILEKLIEKPINDLLLFFKIPSTLSLYSYFYITNNLKPSLKFYTTK